MPTIQMTDDELVEYERMTGTPVKVAPSPAPGGVGLAKQYARDLFKLRGRGIVALRNLKEQYRQRGFNPDQIAVGALGNAGLKRDWEGAQNLWLDDD